MLTNELVNQTVETISAYYQQYSLLLIHPELQARTRVISALLDAPPCQLFYYSPRDGVVGPVPFLVELTKQLAEQGRPVARQVHKTLMKLPNPSARLKAALFTVFQTLHHRDYLLIFDEYDRLDHALDVQRLLGDLLLSLPPQSHLLISSRTLPPFPWVDLIARQRAAVVYGNELRSGNSGPIS
ncbi:MAG TPA: hypothetical protein PK801_17170 [Aggregatilineales bacterium]|nr:hypothetical protein [Chloroflexota bacterium]HOA25480.1 hypothetical protein [Aggregatilineales bacterium]HQA70061.1 hypothetical protein [Aggregatilineales bacterium]HQE19713.1 hypothetical protein [Aggregatilineales bacterium]